MLTNNEIQQIKTVAADKDVIILLEGGHTVTGIFKAVTADHIKLESKEDIIYLTPDSIKALRIRK